MMLIIPHMLFTFLFIYKVSCQGSSLTFVIDDTRSMYDDIAQVRNEVDSIMDIVLNEPSSRISNIVLVTFNDPDVKLMKITRDRDDLKSALADIRVNNYFNYDCPEVALSGIQLALESSLPGSFIYVFTDASAKDYYMREEIEQLCQRKQSQVVFVLTGDCHRPNSKQFQVYYDIATASSGLAFTVDKRQVEAVLRTIRETIRGNQTVLTRRVTPPDVFTNIPFSIDGQTEYAIISASGSDVHLQIYGPSVQTEKIMWTRHGKVLKLFNPLPGKYVATVKGTSATSVVIVGRTDFFFHHGFSEQEPKSFDDTTPQPFAESLSHLSVLVSDPKSSVLIHTAQILGMNENLIRSLPLKEISPNFYITEPFVTPLDMFKVGVTGEVIATGDNIQRISTIPVIPQKAPPGTPKAPVVEISEGNSITVSSGIPLTLTCKVDAYPHPEISWTNSKGAIMPSKSSILQIPYNFINYLKMTNVTEDKYTCHAKNYLGDVEKSIYVKVKDQFIIKTVPEGTTNVRHGNDQLLICDVRSQQPFQILWYRANKRTGATEQIRPSQIYEISFDSTQLTILSMDADLAGKYTCKVSLLGDPKEKREFSTNVEIYGLEKPKIQPETVLIEVPEYMPATVKCKLITGIPAPKISWQFKSEDFSVYFDLAISGAELNIPSATLSNAGLYKCIAVNTEGRAEQTVAELVILKRPIVTVGEGNDITVPYGGQMTLTCKVTAYPAPTVTWIDDGENSLPASMNKFKNEFQYIYTATNVKSSSIYECQAENKVGSNSASIQVTVTSPFSVRARPPNDLKVPYGSGVPLKCDITSNLPMKINWYFVPEDTDEIIQLCSSDKYWISSDATELKINLMDIDVIGAYTCKAFLTKDPDVTMNFTANVVIEGLILPEIDPTLHMAPIKENTLAIIACKILRGLPKPKISWQMKLPGAASYQSIPGTGTELRIVKAAVTNSGLYKCIAENVAGRDERTVAELIVLKTPELTIVEGTSVNVTYGGRFPLTCKVIANPEPSVVWRDSKGNTLVSMSSTEKDKYEYNHSITLGNVKESDDYECSANNNQGSSIKNVQVLVSSPFVVHSQSPELMTGKHGAKVNLICDISSNLQMHIRWYHFNDSTNKEDLVETSELYSISPNGVELIINAMDVGQDGKYSCRASLVEDDDEHITFTTEVELDGLEAPEVTGDGNKKVKASTSVSINCIVLKGTPKPTIRWQYINEDVNLLVDLNETSSVLHIANVKGENSGYYMCNAKNDLGSDEHVVILTVQEPARILSEAFTVYEGIEGDIALRIPCDAIGHPKPTIKWKVEGFTVVNRSKKYSIENGALIIKNPTQSDTNLYTCTAKNEAGSESKTFKGVVHDTLTNYGVHHHVLILEGESKKLNCSLSMSRSSSVKWFLDGEATDTQDTYFSIDNALENDDGNYTCHVSDMHGSSSETFVVEVGYMPMFKRPQIDSVIKWTGDTEDVLCCEVESKPEAVIEWTLNDNPLVSSNSFQLAIFQWGHFRCNVSNVHGAIQREFYVKPSICLIKRSKKEAPYMPLILNEELNWPDFNTSGEYLIMNPKDKLILSCHNHENSPNSFTRFPSRSDVEAVCDSGDTFIVDGRPYQMSDLHCKHVVYPSLVKTGMKCLTTTSEMMKVGYELQTFVEAYEVCFDHARNLPLFTRVLMSRTNDIQSDVAEWYQYPAIGNSTREPYTCKRPTSKCCYAKSALVSPRDFAYGPAQNSTLIEPLNTIPYWRPCYPDRVTWEDLGEMVRARLLIHSHFVVWSGVHTLQERDGSIIPRYLWKLIREMEDRSLVVVYVNDATPTDADIRCENICAGDSWWIDSTDKYTYCCSVSDFVEAFDMPGVMFGESTGATFAKLETH